MVVSDVILGELPVVFLLFLSQEVYGVTLLQQYIADLVNIALNPHGKAKEKVYDS